MYGKEYWRICIPIQFNFVRKGGLFLNDVLKLFDLQTDNNDIFTKIDWEPFDDD